MAALSGDRGMIEAFERNADIHTASPRAPTASCPAW